MLECIFCFIIGGFIGVFVIGIVATAKQNELRREIMEIENAVDERTCFAVEKPGSMLRECSECGESLGTHDVYCRKCGRRIAG